MKNLIEAYGISIILISLFFMADGLIMALFNQGIAIYNFDKYHELYVEVAFLGAGLFFSIHVLSTYLSKNTTLSHRQIMAGILILLLLYFFISHFNFVKLFIRREG